MWYLYILKCSDNTFYTGISQDLAKRIDQHSHGKGSDYTKIRRPIKLVYCERFDSKKEASIREVKVKKLSIKNKEQLILKG